MSTRIRYNKEQSQWTSRQQFILKDGSLVQVFISPETLSFRIGDTQGHTFFEGKAETLTKLQIEARNALKILGYQFKTEVRNRNKTETLSQIITGNNNIQLVGEDF